jgi:hypothetical protein
MFKKISIVDTVPAFKRGIFALQTRRHPPGINRCEIEVKSLPHLQPLGKHEDSSDSQA